MNSGIFNNWTALLSERVPKYQAKSQQLAEKYLKLETLMPWDHSYLNSQMCSLNQTQVDMTHFFELLTKTFSKFGFDIAKLNMTYDIYSRKNKSEWGYQFLIGGTDARILANVSNRFSDYNVLLHETAHATHFLGLNPEEEIFNQAVSGIVSEGFANFFGNLCYSKEFLSEVFVDNADQAFYEFQKLDSVVHLQNYRYLAHTLFDHQLYLRNVANADDIQELRQSVGKETMGEEGYTIPWAKLIHHTSHPIYLHNYFLGDVMNENMKKEFSNRSGGKEAEKNPLEFGQFWKSELLTPSGREPFLDLYKNVFKKEISITDYLDGKCLK